MLKREFGMPDEQSQCSIEQGRVGDDLRQIHETMNGLSLLLTFEPVRAPQYEQRLDEYDIRDDKGATLLKQGHSGGVLFGHIVEQQSENDIGVQGSAHCARSSFRWFR